MPKALQEIPAITNEDAISDSRIERIGQMLQKEFRANFGEINLKFLTWVSKPGWRQHNGVEVYKLEDACFLVVSDNPNTPGKLIRSYGMTPMKDLKKAEKEAGQFMQNGDPALSIFRHLVFDNLRARGSIAGMDEIDEKEWQKRLDQANWVLEQTAGSRYDEVKLG